MTVSGAQTTSGFQEILQRYRGDRKLVLVIVAVALLLDNMLLTSVGMNPTAGKPWRIDKIICFDLV